MFRRIALVLLVATSVPVRASDSARARAESDAGELTRAVARLHTDTGSRSKACLTNLQNLLAKTTPVQCLPANTTAMGVCAVVRPGALCWGGPYIGSAETLIDPWRHAYQASLDVWEHRITVSSIGPDGVPDTDDDIVVPYALTP